MTNENLIQLAEQLTLEQKEKLIAIVCGPEEDWSEASGEFVMRLYGVDPKPDPVLAKEIVGSIIRKRREQGEEVEEGLLNLLHELEITADDALGKGK